MPTTDNGWPASPDLPIRPLVVNGVAFAPGIVDNDDVALILGYVAQQVADRVEAPVSPGCWGFAFRENRNSPDQLSRHSGGIAIDYNAPAHPNGVPASVTFTLRQMDEIRLILDEVDGAVRWGGDFNGTPDAMHFEINVTPAELPALAARLRARLEGLDMTEDRLREIVREELLAVVKSLGELAKVDHDGDPTTAKWSLERMLRSLDA